MKKLPEILKRTRIPFLSFLGRVVTLMRLPLLRRLVMKSRRRALLFGVIALLSVTTVFYNTFIRDIEAENEIIGENDNKEYFIEDEDYFLARIYQLKEANQWNKSPEVIEKRNHENPLSKGNHQSRWQWQEVYGTKKDVNVYSAYFDVNFRVVRVIAVANKFQEHRLECRFPTEGFTDIGRTEAVTRIIRESKEFTYSAAFILCPLPSEVIKNGTELPKYVSVASASRFNRVSPTSNILEIHYPATNSPQTKFAVCVQPTFNYDDSVRFVEWIEFHQSLGVERFTLYNISIGPRVSCIVEEYNSRDEGAKIYIEVLPWGNPSDRIVSRATIKPQNQLAALNDCVYRHRGVSEYVFNIDLDEFIIPHKDSNYQDLMKRLKLLFRRTSIGVYEFRNAFFYPSYKILSGNGGSQAVQSKADETVGDSIRNSDNPTAAESSRSFRSKVVAKLQTLENTFRMSEPFPITKRTKYICNPLKVVEAGIHNAWEMLRGFGTLNIPPEIGMLNHYRDYKKLPVVQDLAAKNLSVEHQVANKVINRISSFLETCNVIV